MGQKQVGRMAGWAPGWGEGAGGPQGRQIRVRNIKIKLAYDGADFHGWQVQPNQSTIQGALQEVLGEIEGDPVEVHGSGRTDAGVHALGQVASFRLKNPIPVDNLQKAMNRVLPPAIRVLHSEEVDADFHPRQRAVSKTYEYRIWRGEVCPPFSSRYVYHHPYPLNEEEMARAATAFAGTCDFRSLAAAGGEEKESTVRTIFSSQIQKDGDLLWYRVRGDGFLYRMVRNVVGTLLEVGRGNFAANDIERILAAKQRSQAGPTVPAKGLFLVEVEFRATTIG